MSTLVQRQWPRPLLSCSLFLLWLLLANSLALGQLVLAVLLAWSFPRLLSRFLMPLPTVKKPLLLLRFVLRVLGDIVLANIQVAVLVLKSNRLLHPAFIELPLDTRDDFVIALLMGVITLTPGTVAATLSADGSYLTIHALHTDNKALLSTQIKQRYEQPLREIFEC